MQFKERIKNLRLSLNKNQHEMASYLGVSIKTYNLIENGSIKLRFKTIEKISNATGWSVKTIRKELY